ncbi:pyrroloquinoline quinone precursor peptide PqqA [Sulfitobacter sabulilitoris]|uniref:Coenzyme PQQ synthesis protein A n=1 Tax=Sulfitobacter sabulilitoris TaxID=2562655 RepID=A0A5S3PC12_9RHOB|nr:pyrroloquinoline quinone precursor peptide PqqA [Sulfitobacter sabulilitoris]TMM51236.1 pyrroloquinoline quinone precursor peptide PqqA [Sulfitobacter sabulilitoris]
MAWTKPVIREIECGMEINMYGPEGEEDAGGVLF